MSEMEFMNLTVGILKEILEDIPDEYSVRCELDGLVIPIMNYTIKDEYKDLLLNVGDIE